MKNKFVRSCVSSFFAVCALFLVQKNSAKNLTSLAPNDPDPIFTSIVDTDYLMLSERIKYREPEFAALRNDLASLSISAFGQNAERGRNLDGQKEFAGFQIQLGDLPAACFTPGGRWNMIALLFGPLPEGECLPPTLQRAAEVLFPGMAPGTINDPCVIDPEQKLGFFTVPLKYRKRGVRIDFQSSFVGGFGFELQTGLVSISQTVSAFQNLTCDRTFDTTCDPLRFNSQAEFDNFRDNVNCFLMRELKNIAEEICLDICDFCEVSIEEIRLNLFWRHLYELNRDKPDWPHVFAMPYWAIGGSISPGKRVDPFKKFAVPFGNNGHSSVGATAGINFDFVNSFEIGAEVGVTHFLSRTVDCLRIPNSLCQSQIYPFAADAKVDPGMNWHFAAILSAYHFLEHLSFWLQYMQIEHKPDRITLRCCDPAFEPENLEKLSPFKVKVMNIGLNYDISPNITLGLFWQAPLMQRNSYRSSTVMFTFASFF